MAKKRAKETFEAIMAQGKKPVGSFIFSNDPTTTAIFGAAGYDWVVIDLEHGMIDLGASVNHIRAAEATGMVPIVRVLENNAALIQKTMDSGAQGIIVPKVGNAEDARKAVAAARYQAGGRGMCPVVPGADFTFNNWSGYRNSINDNVIVIPLIETKAGVDNIEEIVQVDGVDFVFFGLADLSQDLGIDMIDDLDQIQKHWETVAKTAIAHGVHPGAPLGYSFDALAHFGSIDGDYGLLRNESERLLKEFRAQEK